MVFLILLLTAVIVQHFNAKTPDGLHIFGRNFDLDYAPSILIKTTPGKEVKELMVALLRINLYDIWYVYQQNRPRPLKK